MLVVGQGIGRGIGEDISCARSPCCDDCDEDDIDRPRLMGKVSEFDELKAFRLFIIVLFTIVLARPLLTMLICSVM